MELPSNATINEAPDIAGCGCFMFAAVGVVCLTLLLLTPLARNIVPAIREWRRVESCQ